MRASTIQGIRAWVNIEFERLRSRLLLLLNSLQADALQLLLAHNITAGEGVSADSQDDTTNETCLCRRAQRVNIASEVWAAIDRTAGLGLCILQLTHMGTCNADDV